MHCAKGFETTRRGSLINSPSVRPHTALLSPFRALEISVGNLLGLGHGRIATAFPITPESDNRPHFGNPVIGIYAQYEYDMQDFIKRHPFPGPGLAVRILGDVTQEGALDLLRKVDDVYINAIRRAGLYDEIWQVWLQHLYRTTVPALNIGPLCPNFQVYYLHFSGL